jgi:CRISPR-associated endonuclease/helicase Cas3
MRRGQLSLPREARSLVEAVFDPTSPVPAGLQQRSLAAEGKDLSSASVAKMATADLDQCYVRVGADWASDMRTPTRLGEPTTTLRLARVEDSSAWFEDTAFRLRWPLSQLSVRRSQICAPSIEDAALREALEKTQPFVGDDIVTLLLRSAGEGSWQGRAMAPGRKGSLRPVQVLYSKSRGLELIKEG